MLIHSWDTPIDEDEWRAFVEAAGFGQLVAGGTGREVPVVVPTQFLLEDDHVLVHLATPNPVWAAIEENPAVVMCVAGDWSFVPSEWKAVGGEDRRLGIPTTYYAAVQLIGRAEVVDEPDRVALILRRQLAALQPDIETVDPVEHGARLRAIRGLDISVTEVRAKFKYGGNVDRAHRHAVYERLLERDGPGDRAAARHLARRLEDG